MESNGKFTLIVFNTCTREYEEVMVTEEVYRTYCRTRWNIKDNDQSFFDHEIQTSGMIGSQDGAYENFREFIDAINTPEHIILEQMKKEALYQAISALPAADQALVQGLFFKGQSELDYDRIVDKALLVRRLSISANRLLHEEKVPKQDEVEQLDLFTDYAAKEKQKAENAAEHARERKIQETILGIKKKFGKNAILKGLNLEDGATARERNQTIGGHQA